MCPASHSSRSRTSRICSSSARSCSSGTVRRAIDCGRQPLLAPARHPARQVARDPPHADRGGELGGVQRVGVVAADEHDRLVRAGDPRQPRAEARLQDRVGDRARDVRVVELLRGADVDHRRVGQLRPGAGSAAAASTGRRSQRAAVDRDDRLEVRRLRAQVGGRAGDERVLLARRRAARCGGARSRSSSATLRSIDGPPHSDPPRCPGQTSTSSPSSSSRAQRAEDPARALLLLDREVGPRDVAHEQRVAGQHRPRLRPARGVDQRERRVLGPVPGRVHARARSRVAQRELPAVLERLVLVLGRGHRVDVDQRARRRRQPAVPGDVVGVVVGLEDVLDRDAEIAREPQVLADLQPRVDDRRDARVLVADQVATRSPGPRARSGGRSRGNRTVRVIILLAQATATRGHPN